MRELGNPLQCCIHERKVTGKHFGEKLVITTVNNRNVVIFLSTVASIFSDFCKQPEVDDCEVEKTRIVAGLKKVTIFETLPEDHNRDVICTARMSASYFCSCCLTQPQGLPAGTAMERCCAPAKRL